MNIFSNIKKKLLPDPEIGQTYVHCTDKGNPFYDRVVITIVDIQDGWIQYEYVTGGRRWSISIGDLRRFWELEEK